MSITIADFVKQYHMRQSFSTTGGKDQQDCKQMADEKIRRLSGFEELVRKTVIDKSSVLTLLLSIEIFFFSKTSNQNLIQDITTLMNKKEKTHNQYEKWIKNNHDFG